MPAVFVDMAYSDSETVFFVANRSQVEDALAVAACLPHPVWLLSVWDEARLYLQTIIKPDPRLRILNLAAPLPRQAQKFLAMLRGRMFVARLTNRDPTAVFVFGDDINTVQAALIRYIRQRKSPTLLVQDGLIFEYSVEDLVPNDSWLSRLGLWGLRRSGWVPPLRMYGAGECDHLAVYGQSAADLFVRLGVPRRKIHITGSPRFDRLFRAESVMQKQSARPVVLCLGVWLTPIGCGTPDVDEQWLRAVSALAAQRPAWQVILRPHPFEDLNSYRARLKQFGPTGLVLDREMPIHSALQACDVVVMHFPSTVLLEAVALGKPVVFMDLKLDLKRLDFLSEGMLLRLEKDRLANLAQAVETVIEDPRVRAQLAERRQVFIERYLGYSDGCNAQRVAALIDTLHVKPTC